MSFIPTKLSTPVGTRPAPLPRDPRGLVAGGGAVRPAVPPSVDRLADRNCWDPRTWGTAVPAAGAAAGAAALR